MTSVKRSMRLTVSHLCGIGYDHNGAGGLPIRPDVAKFAATVLFSDSPNVGLSENKLESVTDHDVLLQQDGTISVILSVGEKTLYLDILCGGIVTFVKLFEDQDTTIEGVLRTAWPSPLESQIANIDDLIDWLIQE